VVAIVQFAVALPFLKPYFFYQILSQMFRLKASMIEELPEFERKLQVRVIKTAADPKWDSCHNCRDSNI
jgi:hypothetical protein